MFPDMNRLVPGTPPFGEFSPQGNGKMYGSLPPPGIFGGPAGKGFHIFDVTGSCGVQADFPEDAAEPPLILILHITGVGITDYLETQDIFLFV
jgi:hypothetical protein